MKKTSYTGEKFVNTWTTLNGEKMPNLVGMAGY